MEKKWKRNSTRKRHTQNDKLSCLLEDEQRIIKGSKASTKFPYKNNGFNVDIISRNDDEDSVHIPNFSHSSVNLMQEDQTSKSKLISDRFKLGIDDYSFLIENGNHNLQLLNGVMKTYHMNNLLNKSCGIWFLRAHLYIINHTRESARDNIINKFIDYINNFNYIDEKLTLEQRNGIMNINNILKEDKFHYWTLINRSLTNLDRTMRYHIREWIKTLKIDMNIFVDDNNGWPFDIELPILKQASIYFNQINQENKHSAFILFAFLVGISTSPKQAILDQRKIFTIISKLLSNEIIEKEVAFGLLTTPFISLVFAILQKLKKSKLLPRGPQIAKLESNSIMGQACKIAKCWKISPELIPPIFKGINSESMKSIIYAKLNRKPKYRANQQEEEEEQVIEMESCPRLEDM